MNKSFSEHRVAIIIFIISCILSASCSKKKTMDSVEINVSVLPMMHSENVSSLISDSGITRYRLIAKIWDIYNPNDGLYWYFPKGFYVEKFDSLFNVEGSIKSDTAYYYERKSLWRLIGNVKVINLQQEKFETEELFWDENTQKIYSDKNIKIEQAKRIIFGTGFESNQSMTEYDIFRINGYMHLDENQQTSDSLTTQ